jgi:hypothetical protein
VLVVRCQRGRVAGPGAGRDGDDAPARLELGLQPPSGMLVDRAATREDLLGRPLGDEQRAPLSIAGEDADQATRVVERQHRLDLPPSAVVVESHRRR